MKNEKKLSIGDRITGSILIFTSLCVLHHIYGLLFTAISIVFIVFGVFISWYYGSGKHITIENETHCRISHKCANKSQISEGVCLQAEDCSFKTTKEKYDNIIKEKNAKEN